MSAAYITEADAIAALDRVGTSIPYAYYLGTAKHESGYYLYSTDPTSDALGLYQVNPREAAEAGVAGDLRDVDVNTRVMVYLAERNRSRIRDFLGLSDSDPDPWDMGAYLALAHNQGLGSPGGTKGALGTLSQYPPTNPQTYLGWTEYKVRNNCAFCGCDGGGICAYGDDCNYDPGTGVAITPRTPGNAFLASAVGLVLIISAVRLTGLGG